MNSGCFVKGNVPWNKGIKGYQPGGKSVLTRFKKGNIPHQTREIGSRRLTKDGYIEVKTENGFELLHRIIWRENGGRQVLKSEALVFIDGNRKNCAFENLRIESRRSMLDKVRVQNMPEELKKVVAIKVRITRLINEGESSE
jgi:hypothetical protein